MRFAVKEMDAIGQWTLGLPPMIFFNPELPQNRLRFTLMHEVAHLVLHQRSALTRVSEEIEDEANRFAGAFLLPQREIKPYLRRLDIASIANLKRHWRVEMSAILMRAQQLETITTADSRALWIEMSRNDWKKREPEHLDVFGGELGGRYRELVALHRKELGYSERELSEIFKLSEMVTREHILPPSPGLRLVV